MQGVNEQISERRHPNEPQGATAARLACLPATGRRRVAAPQQPQQWLQAKAKELLEEEAANAAAANRWKQWAKHRDEQQSTSNQLQTV